MNLTVVGVEVQGRRRSTSQAMVVWEFPPINAQGWACVWMNWVSPRMTHTCTHTDSVYACMRRHKLKSVLFWQDDEVVLQCVACIQKENRKFCLAAEGLGNRLCYLEPTSEAKVGNTGSTVAPFYSLRFELAAQQCMSSVWDVSISLCSHTCVC